MRAATIGRMPLATMPVIERLTLASVSTVPEWHPEHRSFEPFPVFAWVVRHPGGVILVDTGIGLGNEFIDELYRPEITPITDALGSLRLTPADIAAVVLSHLHFDHCGQQDVFEAPVYVQALEIDAAATPGYTVPEWAAIAEDRLRPVDGGLVIAEGVRLLPTPGHTPGHQSVVIEAEDGRVVLAAQCAFRGDELRSGVPSAANLHDVESREVATDSLRRVRALGPVTLHLSHDPEAVVLPAAT